MQGGLNRNCKVGYEALVFTCNFLVKTLTPMDTIINAGIVATMIKVSCQPRTKAGAKNMRQGNNGAS